MTSVTPSKITDYFPPSPKSGLEEDGNKPSKEAENGNREQDHACKSSNTDEPVGITEEVLSNIDDVVNNTEEVLSNTEEVLSTTEDVINQTKEVVSNTKDCGNNETECKTEETVLSEDMSSETKPPNSDLSNTSSVFLTPKTSPDKDDAARTMTGESKQQHPACRKSLSEEVEKEVEQPKELKKKGRRKKRGGSYTPAPKTAHISGTSKPRSASKKSKDTEPKKDTHITDYFPVRRSERRCKSDLDKEKVQDLEYKVLNGVEDGLKVEDIQNKGRGVVAMKPFRRGDFVVEYAGDHIDMKEAKAREAKYSKKSDVGCYMYYFNFKNKQYCIDATAESGKLGRLLNHSKTAGNCHTKLVEIKGEPYLILVASRDISTGEELQYDYGDRSKASIDSHPWLKS